ncbi:MAG: regulatory protein GemA [Pseudomonadota bacterium]
MTLADNYQKRVIKSYQRALGLDDECYRDMLEDRFNKRSAKDLTNEQAREFIEELKEKAQFWGVYKKPKAKNFNRYKYNELDGRGDQYPTGKQLRMLNAAWNTNPNVREKTDSAFEAYVCRIAKVEKIEWLLKKDVNKVKLAIDNIKKAQK